MVNFSNKVIMEYQNKADATLALVCRYVAGLLFTIAFLNFIGVFVIKGVAMNLVMALSIIIALLPTLIFTILDIHTELSQYFILTAIVLMCGLMYAVVSYHAVMMLIFPVVCACLYSERKLIIYTMIISIPMIVISHICAYYLHIVPDEPLITMHGVIVYGIIPRIIQFLAIGSICLGITTRLRRLIQILIDKNHELYEDQQMLVESLSELVETQSQETGQHVKRVSEYTKILCMGLGYDDEKTWKVSIASMMHDVGKLLVPTSIIEKPGKLTDEEFEEIKKHVDYAKKMLEKSPGEIMQLSATIAYEHHERYDGTGYKHKKGEEISPYARIVSIADVFDALVSVRPYKKAWSAEDAYEEIISQSGKQFDPKVVSVFKDHFLEFKEVMEKYPESREIKIEELIKR